MALRLVFTSYDYIYLPNGRWVEGDSFATDDTTYVFTYYQSSGSPYPSAIYPSWGMVPQGSSVIPLKEADMYLITSNNYNPVTGNVCIPSVLNGQTIRIYDIGNYLSTTQLSFTVANGAKIEGSTPKVYSTNGLIKFLYYHASSWGNAIADFIAI